MKSRSNKTLISTGVIAAIASSLCCITPVLALIAGSSGLASSFSWMEPLRPYLIGFTVLVLGFAWYQKLKPRTAEELACACEEDELSADKAGKPSFWQSKKFLGIVTVFAALMIALPYYSKIFYSTPKKEVVYVKPSDFETVSFNIKGMECQACNDEVNAAALGVKGVLNAKTDYSKGKAVVKIDKSKTSVQAVKKAIETATPYKIVGETVEKK